MKKIYLFLASMAVCAFAEAKPVDVATAQRVGYNFLSGKVSTEVLRGMNDLQLVYTAVSDDAQAVNCYYVFNAGNAGFVMVSADDQVKPVFGYSNEAGFDANNIPENSVNWFKNFKVQISYVIAHNSPATDKITAAWKELLSGNATSGNKTTAVSPLVTTKWNQVPLYNAQCPANSQGRAVTGCVATAMAQIMKFWNYPTTGVGSHTYTPNGFGAQTANFAGTTYQWANMPNALSSSSTTAEKNAVAQLMLHAGISVEMQYGVNSSGSYVTTGYSPITHCAQFALGTYFNYDAGLTDIYHDDMSDQDWIDILKDELDLGRPFLYAGYTVDQSGHVWVADGYDANDFFHINWGWGGSSSDGYYDVTSMNPPALGTGGGTGGGFDYHQHAIIGITPKSNIPADMYEPNNTPATTYDLPLGINGINGSTSANGSFHVANDMDYYSVTLPNNDHKYKITARVHDLKNSANGNVYTVDAKFGYSSNQNTWSVYFDSSLTNPLTSTGGATTHFRVAAQTLGKTGTYFFEAKVTDMTLGITDVITEMISVYPNPVTDVLNISLDGVKASQVSVTDVNGRVVRTIDVANKADVTISVDGMANGTYFVRIQSDNGTITKQITVGK